MSVRYVRAPDKPLTVYDGYQWDSIPKDALAVGGYVNGRYRWPYEAWLEFPHAMRIPILIHTPGTTEDPSSDCHNLIHYAAGIHVDRKTHVVIAIDHVDVASVKWAGFVVKELHQRGWFVTSYSHKLTLKQLKPARFDNHWIIDPSGESHQSGAVAVQWSVISGPIYVSTTNGHWPRSPEV